MASCFDQNNCPLLDLCVDFVIRPRRFGSSTQQRFHSQIKPISQFQNQRYSRTGESCERSFRSLIAAMRRTLGSDEDLQSHFAGPCHGFLSLVCISIQLFVFERAAGIGRSGIDGRNIGCPITPITWSFTDERERKQRISKKSKTGFWILLIESWV